MTDRRFSSLTGSNRGRRASSPNWVVVALVLAAVAYSAWKSRAPEPADGGSSSTSNSEPAERGDDLPKIIPRIEGEPPRPKTGDTNGPSVVQTPASDADKPPEVSKGSPATSSPRPGELRETRPGVFESSAGLVYRKGGAQGHRLDHVMEHASDDSSKPVHGVFIGNREEILALIDEAFELAQKRGPPQVTIEKERDRTVYTVDLKRKVGYLGGQSGARKKRPALTGVRLVLEGRDVITAFPVDP